MKRLIVFLLLLFPISAFTQSKDAFLLEGTIKGYPGKTLLLNRVIGHKEQKFREISTRSDGSFNLIINSLPQVGFYRIRPDQPQSRDVINLLLSGESIGLSTVFGHFTDSVRFSGAQQNLALHDFLKLKEDHDSRLSILEHLLSIYPADKRFYPLIMKEIEFLQNEMDAYLKEITTKFPGTLLASYTKSSLPPRFNPSIPAPERKEFALNNFLNNINFTDTLLLYTDLFPNKTISFIMQQRNQSFDRSQQAAAFIKSVDKILSHALIEPKVFNYILEYLISGFEQIGFEEVLTHIANNYEPQEQCMSNHESGELQRRIEGYKRLAEGNPAFAIETNDIAGKHFNLASIKADDILLFFYATWCPHCMAMLPKLRELAISVNSKSPTSKHLKLVAVAISIDTDKQAYLEFLKKNSLDAKEIEKFWFNLADFKGWDGKIANDYYLYATPTMILLDHNLIIKRKPSTVEELQVLLKE